MIYLDYSATTPVSEDVLDTFNKVSKNYPGNPNSLHKLGLKSKHLMEEATKQVANLLQVEKDEIIFTSSASESNNMALVGIVEKYPLRNKHIITTKLEHSSIIETVSYLEKKGYKIDYVNILENGQIDLEHLKQLLEDKPLIVSIAEVNSEVGIIQDVQKIGELIKKYPTTFFHVDGTQAVGKIPVNLTNVDLYSFSAHKFFGLKGIGCLVKKKSVSLEPIIHGGKSQTIYRSGTPALPLIVSLSKAMRLALTDLNQKQSWVTNLNQWLRNELEKIDGVTINSPINSSPYILNISIKNVKSETMLHALEEKEVYISTKTACAKKNDASLSLLAMNKSKEIASASLRISFSYQTTMEEVEKFLKIFKKCYSELNLKKEE